MAWGERSSLVLPLGFGEHGPVSRVLTCGASKALWCFLWVSMAHCACTALLLSGAFLCLLLLLWVLLLLLVLLPLVGTFGPLQLHASTTFKGQFSRVLTSGASEALWCFLWVSMAHCACTALLLCGAFLCLLLLLCVLLLLLVLLPLVGTVGPLQLHPSTTFNNVRASRSLLRQVFFSMFFSFFLHLFFDFDFESIFLRFWRGWEGFWSPKWLPKSIFGVIFSMFFWYLHFVAFCGEFLLFF